MAKDKKKLTLVSSKSSNQSRGAKHKKDLLNGARLILSLSSKEKEVA